ncbi:MAG: hypothetical protein AAGK00_11980 [Pseudomonadota bacterium]
MTPLVTLHAAAIASDSRDDWRAFYQALAGTLLVVPITEAEQLDLAEGDAGPIAQAYLSLELYAGSIDTVARHAEVPGNELSRLLADAGVPLEVITGAEPVLLGKDQLAWIADTYGAEVTRDVNQGVRIAAPDQLAPQLLDVIGQSVAALGPSCRAASLVTMTDQQGDAELVLVLVFDSRDPELEGRLAETVTRAVQAVTDQRFAVACPDPDSALAARAAEIGIGVMPVG